MVSKITENPSGYKPPKEYKIKSREWPITVEEAGRILIEAKEIKKNKELYKAALKHLQEKIKTMQSVT